jgi:hypothetical protein
MRYCALGGNTDHSRANLRADSVARRFVWRIIQAKVSLRDWLLAFNQGFLAIVILVAGLAM